MTSLMDILQYLVTGVLLGGVYGVMSLGLSMIFGVMGLINFAHGSSMMLAMYTTYFFWLLLGIHPFISLILLLPIFFVFGATIQKVFISRVIYKARFSQLLLTLGLSIVFQNAAQVLWKADYRNIIGYATDAFNIGAFFVNKAQLTAFVVSMIMALILSLFLSRTDFGKAIRATADDRETATLMGIDVDRIYLVTFGIGTALVGGAGAVVMMYYPVFPAVAWDFIFLMFISVVLGGLGSIKGSLIGGLTVGIVQSLCSLFLPLDLRNIGIFVMFLVTLLVRPHGLYGKRLELEAKG